MIQKRYNKSSKQLSIMLLRQIYSDEIFSSIFTDHYHLTTSQLYFANNRHDEQAIFYACIRNNYPNNNYTVFSSIHLIAEFIQQLKKHPISISQKKYLLENGFCPDFCDFLSSLQFDIQIFSLQEGSIFFPQQPIFRIKGSIVECKLLEPVILNILNSHCAYATHANRIKFASSFDCQNGTPEGITSVQGLRRGLSLGASLESSNTLRHHGYQSTSTILEAYFSNSSSVGTMDHCWVMSHKTELEAFEQYAISYPNNGIFLVDTYDIQRGIENAILVLKKLRSQNCGRNYGIRIDSSDVFRWSFYALRRFFEEKLISNNKSSSEIRNLSDSELLRLSDTIDHSLFCCASDGIDENRLLQLRRAGCFIKFWGVGTAGCHVPPLGIVYKISQLLNRKVVKLSGEKSSLPGILNSKYLLNHENEIAGVLIYDEKIPLSPQAIDYFSKQITTYENYSLSKPLLQNFNITYEPQNNSLKTQYKNNPKLSDFTQRTEPTVLIDSGLWTEFKKIINNQ